MKKSIERAIVRAALALQGLLPGIVMSGAQRARAL